MVELRAVKDGSRESFDEKVRKSRWMLCGIISVLVVILGLSIVLAINFGPVSIKTREVVRIILYNTLGIRIGDSTTLTSGVAYEIIWKIRFPRIILAIIVGMGLSIVGTVMQAMVQNPLADPYVLGISSGASLGATIAIMLGVGTIFGGSSVGICAFLGAFLCSIFVYTLSSIGGRSSSIKLVLSGMVISAICSSFSSFIIFTSNNVEGMRTLTFWLMGSLAGASWSNIAFPSIAVVACCIFFSFQFRNLNIMLMGEENAITLGIDLNFYRKVYILITSFVTGVIVYSAGTIGFVGLMIPHVVRMLVGPDHRKMIPVSALIGAIFLIWTDVLARSVMNVEIPIGIITSMLGAPFFMCLMIKKAYGFGGE